MANRECGEPNPLQGLDAAVGQALQDWKVPGLALAIVKDDSVVLSKGYGVRELGQPAPVDERTLFAIGSVTKAFTAAALGMLVDEGKLGWDDPVTEHLPDFLLYDPYVTREITLRDLLTHRSGLPRGDLIWIGSDFDRAEILRRVRYLPPRWSFRSHFGYQNILYLVAGQVVATVTGRSWDTYIRERIFAPLGMTNSSTSVTALVHAANVATPHADVDGQVRPVPYRNIDRIAPAGAINSNVAEMTQWIRLLLAGGVYGGQRLLSAATMAELFTPQTIMGLEAPEIRAYGRHLRGLTHFAAYGLGWMLYDYRGRKIASHTGAIDGMRAALGLVPEERLGVIIFTNLNFENLAPALMLQVLDAYLGAPPRDTVAEWLAEARAADERAAQKWAAREKERASDTTSSLPLEQYAGVYEDAYCGRVTVTHEDGALVLGYGRAHCGDLTHWHYDTFLVTWRQRHLDRSFATFALNSKGAVETLVLEDTGWGQDYMFNRLPG